MDGTYNSLPDQSTDTKVLTIDAPKTKTFSDVLNNLKISDGKSLFVLAENNRNIYLSSRNMVSSKVITVDKLNTYDILDAKNLVISESAVDMIDKQFKA